MTFKGSRVKRGVALTAVLGTLLSCGTGVDPLILFDDSIPALDQIVAGTVQSSFLTGGYSSSTPYWTFNSLNLFTLGQFLAPATGVVTEVTVDSITILHSGRMKTRLVGLQTVNIRVGDTVTRGQAIAQFLGSGAVQFWVYLDGQPVCPYSFLTQSFRAGFGTWAVFNPCI